MDFLSVTGVKNNTPVPLGLPGKPWQTGTDYEFGAFALVPIGQTPQNPYLCAFFQKAG